MHLCGLVSRTQFCGWKWNIDGGMRFVRPLDSLVFITLKVLKLGSQ